MVPPTSLLYDYPHGKGPEGRHTATALENVKPIRPEILYHSLIWTLIMEMS